MGKRELWYFVLYRSTTDRRPAGIAVQGFDGTEGHGLIWSHRAGAWTYDPGGAGGWMTDNPDRSDEVTREEAERAAPIATGGQELPDEDTIWWIFQWKGEPPQNED